MAQDSQTQIITDQMDPARADALAATLGLPARADDALMPFGHQIYFWQPEPPERLGPDCHPRVGLGLIPDLGLPQRMWAGGALAFHAPIKLGVMAEKVSKLIKAEEKQGRTGRLGFVSIEHQISQGGVLCTTERQDLVYKDHDASARRKEPPRADEDEIVSEPVIFDTNLLFRYSALTFNGHRIHYDLDYAREVEGYPGLVVHGPLLAQLLMLMAERQLGQLRSFTFRATAPLMHFEAADLCWKADGTMWVRGPEGRLCMTAQAG